MPTLSRAEKLYPAHTAVLVVDVQNAWCHRDGPRFLNREPEVLATLKLNLELLTRSARASSALRVFIRTAHDPVFLSPAYGEQLRIQGTYGRIVAGSWDADYWEDMRPQRECRDVEVTKHRYSAFRGTNLELVLSSNGIKTIVVCGVATGGCVFATALEGFLGDYYTVIAADAVADRDQTVHDVFLRRFQDTCGEVLSAADIVKSWPLTTSARCDNGALQNAAVHSLDS